jgi:hypothetical protein
MKNGDLLGDGAPGLLQPVAKTVELSVQKRRIARKHCPMDVPNPRLAVREFAHWGRLAHGGSFDAQSCLVRCAFDAEQTTSIVCMQPRASPSREGCQYQPSSESRS